MLRYYRHTSIDPLDINYFQHLVDNWLSKLALGLATKELTKPGNSLILQFLRLRKQRDSLR